MSTISGELTLQGTEITGTLTVDETVVTGTLGVVTGPTGPGLPPGGSIGQTIQKSGVGDYVTQWVNPAEASVPAEVTQHITRTDNPHNVQENQIPEGIDYVLLFNNALI